MSTLLGEKKEGLLFVLSAPAGTGKTTLIQKLLREFPSAIASVSYTTRPPRLGERDGIDYNFITPEEFEKKIATGDFLEYVHLYGNYYGTSSDWVRAELKKGKHVFLVIDTQGALKIKKTFAAILIFVSPPSLTALEKRLIERGTEVNDVIKKRLEWAKNELEVAKQYDYQFINDDLEIAYDVLRSIFIAACHLVSSR